MKNIHLYIYFYYTHQRKGNLLAYVGRSDCSSSRKVKSSLLPFNIYQRKSVWKGCTV